MFRYLDVHEFLIRFKLAISFNVCLTSITWFHLFNFNYFTPTTLTMNAAIFIRRRIYFV